MRFTIRVTLVAIFSAFALWSRTIAANESTLNDPSLPASDQLTFRLDLPKSGTSGLVLASNSTPNLGGQTASSQPPPSARTKAFSYGNGYLVRRKIHKYASIATLPLFVSEAIVGQKLIGQSDTADSLRSTHSALAAGIGVLFGVNSVTGIWNLWDARKDPNGRGKRTFHSILMLAADAGFVATAATAPKREGSAQGVRAGGNATTHGAIAYASIGVATVGYVCTLFAR